MTISGVVIGRVVDDLLTTLLEEHGAKQLKLTRVPSVLDEHLFLIIDKNIPRYPL